MKSHIIKTTVWIAIAIFTTSCISTLFKESPPTFSDAVKFTNPTTPFLKTKTSVYPSWRNSQTGNVISIISECNDASDKSIGTLHYLVEGSLKNIDVKKEELTKVAGHDALLKSVQASLDYTSIEVESVSFKHKNCGYVASLSGKVNNTTSDQKSFQDFLAGINFND